MSGQPTPQEAAGLALRQRREAAGLSREGLAYKAQVSLKTVERLERGENLPRRATFAVIDAALTEIESGAAA